VIFTAVIEPVPEASDELVERSTRASAAELIVS
jgi:hypothetical protein